MRYALALIVWLLSAQLAFAGHAEPVGCPQTPALTGAVTTSAGSCATSLAAGSGQTAVAAPTAPNSAAVFRMQGLAGSVTPVSSGRVLIVVSGDFINSSGTINTGLKVQLSFGTGSAPANAAAITGTQVGTVRQYTNPVAVTAANVSVPFSVNAVVTGLALNTAVWIDLAAQSITTASTGGMRNVSVSVIEY